MRIQPVFFMAACLLGLFKRAAAQPSADFQHQCAAFCTKKMRNQPFGAKRRRVHHGAKYSKKYFLINFSADPAESAEKNADEARCRAQNAVAEPDWLK